jgi:hypothetical protein
MGAWIDGEATSVFGGGIAPKFCDQPVSKLMNNHRNQKRDKLQ